MGKKVFVIDVARCTGCYSCQTACKDEYCGNDWSPYSKPQPVMGQFWLHLLERQEGSTPKVKVNYTPTLCNHCENPACLTACSKGAISRHEDHGFVIIEPDKCDGCGDCAKACPYDSIYMNAELKIAQKCTGCAHLLDNGFSLPRCVEACPTDALKFGDEETLTREIEGTDVLKPREGTKPNVFYRNLPGRFIGGLVYDPVSKTVVENAKVRLLSGGKRRDAVSDIFGDFWFKDLPAGWYDLYIDAEGYATEAIRDIHVPEDNSVNLGDIALTRQEKKIMTKEEWETIKEQGATNKVDADDYRFARA